MSGLEIEIYRILLIGWFVVAGLVFVFLFFVSAPYGRHSRPGWGPTLQSRIGWLAMEAVSPLAFSFFFLLDNDSIGPVTLCLFLLWNLHYVHRAFVYPFRMRGGKRPMAVSVVLLAVLFNGVNGYLNGRYLNYFGSAYTTEWLLDPRFLLGLGLFTLGFGINYHSDGVLRGLREAGETGYRIPRSGVFKLVTSANYFGEILEWAGWALLTWSPAGLCFAAWTAANLIPRARSHHHWYRDKFPDYPPERRVILPFLY
jgi:hypothetical protein